MTRQWIYAVAALLFASSNVSAQVVWGLWGFPPGSNDHPRLVTFPANAPQNFTVVGETSFNITTNYPNGLDFDGAGNLFATGGTAANFFYSVNMTNGATTLIGGSGLAPGRFITDLAYDRFQNRMLAITSNSNPEIYSINTSTGAATSLGTVTGTTEGLAISFAVRPSDGAMFMHGLTTNRWYSINPTTLAATALNTLPFATNFGQGGTFDPNSGALLHAAVKELGGIGQGTLYQIDQITGNPTLIGILGGGPLDGNQVTDIAIQPIPEPASLVLVGVVGAAWMARRKLKKTKATV